MSQLNRNDAVSRRGALKLFLLPLSGLVAQRLLSACADDGDRTRTERGGAAGARGSDASTDMRDANSTGAGDASVPWASGGTKAMKGGYPDPFASGAGAACMLSKAMILGPCYATTVEREDISEGVPGVPMRLSLLVVRADGCSPVAGATVDIWHAGVGGVYSEFAGGTQCNPGTEDLRTPKFCRGVQTADANGRVNFNTIIPGWYAGRAVHVHFTVRVNGKEYVTSQLFFDDALLDEIEREVDYKARGTRDTRNTTDIILPANDSSPYVLNTAKRADGALHAWKVLALRSSLDEELPAAGGQVDFLGDGGFPGGGFPGGGLAEGGFPGVPPSGFPRRDGGSEGP